uniref:Tetraspanin n=1 Tax=Strigamia maritima TaxID=126957 RepID=T1J6S8_STRMM
MLLRSAMRYYRLWIYSCNGVLLLSVLVFVAVGGSILADVRMRFVPLALYHPTLVYGYVALLLQAGIIQAVGCVSAIKLNERWLNVYWLLMLVLLVGDAIVGLAWMFLFSSLKAGIPAHLKHLLNTDYGADGDRTALWDKFQQESACCGVQGPSDYNTTQWYIHLPQGHLPDFNDSVWSSTASLRRLRLGPRASIPVPVSCCQIVNTTSAPCWSRGCAEPLRQWVQRSADVLFILGYCIIAFLKLCFLGILRYEIREMIQKIRLLQGELQALPDLANIGMPSPNHVSPTSPSSNADKMMTHNGNNNEIEMKELTLTEARL